MVYICTYAKLQTTVYLSKIARTDLKLGQNAFQTIPDILFFDPQLFLFACVFFRFFSDLLGSGYYFEELRIFGRHRHIIHAKLPHIDLLSALYHPKSGSGGLANKGVLVNKGVWLTKGSWIR